MLRRPGSRSYIGLTIRAADDGDGAREPLINYRLLRGSLDKVKAGHSMFWNFADNLRSTWTSGILEPKKIIDGLDQRQFGLINF